VSVQDGFVVDKVAVGRVFSEYFGFPCLIPPIAPQSPSPIIWGWYNRPQCKGLSPTSLAIKKLLDSMQGNRSMELVTHKKDLYINMPNNDGFRNVKKTEM
jgi:hypothetical protein